MTEVPSKEEFEALCKIVQLLQLRVMELRAGQNEWVTKDEASRLSGRSKSWFDKRGSHPNFPIAIMARSKNSGRVFFSRADCIAFARKHAIRPSLSVELAEDLAKMAQSQALLTLQPITSWLSLYKVN